LGGWQEESIFDVPNGIAHISNEYIYDKEGVVLGKIERQQSFDIKLKDSAGYTKIVNSIDAILKKEMDKRSNRVLLNQSQQKQDD
jgi:hypothetical protein